LLEGIAPGKFLEIGVGSGRFYEDLVRRGFFGLCLDLNPDLVQEHLSSTTFPPHLVDFRIQNFFSLSEKFDLLVAFEVLEHYEDDMVCLKRWRELLDTEGALLFSVPAHMRLWTDNDTRAGHARRYEKADLLEKLKRAGFLVEHVWCYGFPVLNVTYRLSSKFAPRFQAPRLYDPLMTDCGRTYLSGKSRFPWLAKFTRGAWFWEPLLYLQSLAREMDLGTGYILKCLKSVK
jgi:SAM-dependent methyltransferase